ncbi:hypothetical protein GCM10027200_04070 [Lentzea nigeriaca]
MELPLSLGIRSQRHGEDVRELQRRPPAGRGLRSGWPPESDILEFKGDNRNWFKPLVGQSGADGGDGLPRPQRLHRTDAV